MSKTKRLFEQLSFAIFLLCCSTPTYGKPVDEVSTIKKRSVSEHQFMHDKSRAIQELQRRIWLHNVMGELHTAEGRRMTQSQPPRHPKQPATWPESPDLAVLLIKLEGGSDSEGTRTPLEQTQETHKPAPFKYQNAKKNSKRKKPGKNSKRKAQRSREEKGRRHARSAASQVRDPGSASHSEPLPTAASGRLWN
ncbi:parathyroid hormone-related protein-like [Mustelus asterias]